MSTDFNAQTPSPNLVISETAQQHFSDLLEKAQTPDLNLRIFVSYPGTQAAEVGIVYCPEGEQKATDLKLDFANFRVYLDKTALPALQDASIDYEETDLESALCIKAPNLKKAHALESEAMAGKSLQEKIEFVIETEINPMLASHGGEVALIDLDVPKGIVKVRFSGGCQGCAMASQTLKQGIEQAICDKFPEIQQVLDATLHEEGISPYY